MGFSGGGTNLLKPHKHSSAAQDGSPLNMVNVTEGSLNAGDIVFSDGSALQRLAIGIAAQQIKVNAGATAPEWFTPTAIPTASSAQTIITSGGHLTTTSSTLVDLGLSLTLPNTGGTLDCLCTMVVSSTLSAGSGDSIRFTLVQNVTPLVYTTDDPNVTGSYNNVSLNCLCNGDGSVLKVQWSLAGGVTNTAAVRVTTAWATPSLTAFAVG